MLNEVNFTNFTTDTPYRSEARDNSLLVTHKHTQGWKTYTEKNIDTWLERDQKAFSKGMQARTCSRKGG